MNDNSLRILLIDDEEELLELAVDAFEMEDFQVSWCLDGATGLEKFNKEPPFDAIIIDENMVGLSGSEVLEKINEANSYTPIIYFSSGDVDIDGAQLKQKGVKDVFYKPYDLDEIVGRVKDEINQKRVTAEAS